MQPIERYALVTLLFLVVLVMVVALWDDGSVEPAEPKEDVVARLEDPAAHQRQDGRRATAPTNAARALPLADRNQPAADMRRVQTRPESKGQHSLEPGAARGGDAFEVDSFKPRQPKAQSAAELEGLMTPERRGQPGGASPSPFMGRPGSGAKRSQSPRTLSSNLDGRDSADTSTSRTGPRESAYMPRPARDTNEQPRTAAKGGKRSGSADRQPAASTSRSYVVKSGDSLERIARHELPGTNNKAAQAEIARLNGLTAPFTIYAGDDLQIPASSAIGKADSGGAAPKAPVVTDGRSVHTIKSGEVLSSVLYARYGTYGRSIDLVKGLNPGLNPDRITPGTKIVMPRNDEIPGGVKKVAKSSASTKPTRRAAATSSEFVVR